jgi:hypothetical protein
VLAIDPDWSVCIGHLAADAVAMAFPQHMLRLLWGQSGPTGANCLGGPHLTLKTRHAAIVSGTTGGTKLSTASRWIQFDEGVLGPIAIPTWHFPKAHAPDPAGWHRIVEELAWQDTCHWIGMHCGLC